MNPSKIMNDHLIIVWNEIQERLYHFILGRINDPELAKDITQDVFLKVHQKIDQLKHQEKLIPWIFQITRNEIINSFRKRKNQVVDFNINEQNENTIHNELSACIIPMINKLPSKYREAILMADIEGLSQKEISAKTKISYSGAKSRVQRARLQLKKLFLDCCNINNDKYGNVFHYEEKSCSHNCQ